MGLALSTAWNSFQHSRAKKLLSEIKSVGFESLELGFSLTPAIVQDISSFVDNNEIKIVSLHNYCPIPNGLRREEALPDYYPMSSMNDDIRSRSIKYAKITIDTARKLNAKAVVLHCGRVDIPDRTRELAIFFKQGLKDSREYMNLKGRIIKERDEVCKSYLQNTLKSLEELNRYAQEQDILLGIENRFYVREIPSFEELGIILDNFRGSHIFYWHDTGHAQVMDNLGFNKHREYLERFSSKMIGVHLHNCVGTHDHLAPAQGEIDFKMFLPYITSETLKVIEAHPPASAADLEESKKYLELIFDGKL
jgi:sugar phosphate isomerase/epimerase